jgi:DNA (cytosine-5)-methyltransferase 1
MGVKSTRKKRKSTWPERRRRLKFHARSEPIASGPTCIDLFSGAGGLAEGFRQAGWSILSGNDSDREAGETFRLNFPEASFFEGSISGLEPKELLKDAGLKAGELDCLIGGPPCQSFSYNNHQRSASNARARLFRDYLRIVKGLKPRAILMENVPGMLTIGNGRIIEEIKTALAELGYECEVRILYAEDFGVPQARRRAFIVGRSDGAATELFPDGKHGPSSKPEPNSNPFVHHWKPKQGTRAKRLVTVGNALGDLPIIRNGGGQPELPGAKLNPATTEFQRNSRVNADAVYNHQCHALTDPMLTRIKHVPEGGNWRDIPRRLLTAGMRRAKKNCHTKRYGRLDRDDLASTVLTKCDPHWGAYIHPTQTRTISVREAARLQGFPDRFRFSGSLGSQYTQVGNAVPVAIGLAFGKKIESELSDNAVKRFRKRAA